MDSKVLWVLPYNSIDLSRFLFGKFQGETIIGFDFFDDESEKHYSCAISFVTEHAMRHSSEKFAHYVDQSYDSLVEINDSPWINELHGIDRDTMNIWNPKHYAIYVKDHGLFEIVASDYRIIEPREGRLDEVIPWITLR